MEEMGGTVEPRGATNCVIKEEHAGGETIYEIYEK